MKANVYQPNEWRLFIDYLQCSLKAVLLYSGNEYASIPIPRSTKLKESYKNMKYALEKINQLYISQVAGLRGLKIIPIIQEQQAGFTDKQMITGAGPGFG